MRQVWIARRHGLDNELVQIQIAAEACALGGLIRRSGTKSLTSDVGGLRWGKTAHGKVCSGAE